MPKIDARTVAEHRDLHEAKLLDAALELVASQPLESLTLAGLAKRAGRSRASMYAYFRSTDELRAEVCAQVLGAWVAGVLDEVRQATLPDDRLDRFVAAQIEQRADPSVDRMLAYAQAQQDEPFRARVVQVVEPLTTELLAIIGRLGVDPPTRAATVVQGAIAAAYDQVRAGADPHQVAQDTVVFVRAGLAALRRTGSPGRPGGAGPVPADHLGDVTDPSQAPHGPGALAMSSSPSGPWLLSAAVATAERPAPESATPRPVLASRRRLRATTIAGAQLAWAVAAFATGALRVGGAGLHLVLGLSLLAILAWSIRALAPAVVTPRSLRAMFALAVATSAAALVARSQQMGLAVVTHVALATVLLVGLSQLAGAVRRSQRAMTIGARGL